jgi:hypothetical protein
MVPERPARDPITIRCGPPLLKGKNVLYNDVNVQFINEAQSQSEPAKEPYSARH